MVGAQWVYQKTMWGVRKDGLIEVNILLFLQYLSSMSSKNVKEDTQIASQPAVDSDIPILLIYYNFKGIGQMIRYLLCYLEIPFIDIFLDQYEKQKETLPLSVLSALKSKVINRHHLPAIIHKNEIIYDLNQITNYICLTYERQDLLGIDIRQKARVCQIQEIYSLKLIWVIRFFKSFVEEVNKITDTTVLFPFVYSQFQLLFRQSGYFYELSTYLLRQQKPQFVLGNLTIVDFYFIESSRVGVALFGCLDETLALGHWVQDAERYRNGMQHSGGQIKHVKNLQAMKRFIDFFSSQPFYKKSQKYLESFHHSPLVISREQYNGMKKLFATHSMDLYYEKNQ